MKRIKHIELSSDLIKKITAYFPSKIFKSQSHLFYEGQVPISGFLILDGSIQISKKKKFKKILQAGSLLGLFELMHKMPIPISAEAFPNTEVCFIDKTTLLELDNQGENEIVDAFKSLLSEDT
jgi:CRP-like cAMP-binding protein